MTSGFGLKRSNTFGGLQRARAQKRAIYLGSGALVLCSLFLGSTVFFTSSRASARIDSAATDSIDKIVSTTPVLIPHENIKSGTKLSLSMFRQESRLRNEIPTGAMRLEDLQQGAYAKTDMPAGIISLTESISSVPPLGNVADLVKPGYRAATIEVDATSGVEGWATAGAHVDVVVTYIDEEDSKKKSQIAIEDAVVLSFNRNTSRGGGINGSPDPSSFSSATVTLSLPTMDAVKLHTARSLGKISLILRSGDDIKSVGKSEVTPEDFRSKPVKSESKVAKNSSGFARFTDSTGAAQEFELKDGQSWAPNANN